jgi:hypothetical protein
MRPKARVSVSRRDVRIVSGVMKIATPLMLVSVLCLILSATPAAAVRCGVPDLEQYRSLVQPVLNMTPSHAAGDPRTPPTNPQVGDSWYWYTWRLNGPPTAVSRLCTVRGMGQTVYVVVENSQWGTRVNQADVDAIVNAWDNASIGPFPDKGIYQLDTENFGPAPDELDHDPRIYILYYDFDISADGFFWVFDEYPDGSQPYASNECEVLYLNSSDNDPGGDYLISVQAHEFAHMIHWLADENEATWLNEGLAELAMWLYGHPDQVVSFPSTPDINLTTWSNGFADYVKVYLWSLYFYEHFGGQPTIRDLIARTTQGLVSVQQTLTAIGSTTTVADEVRDWVTANYLDDPTIEGGRYNYAGEDLPTFTAVTRSTYPVPVTSAAVNHWAGDYIRFINGQPLRLNFDGGDSGTWAARVVKYQAGVPLSVTDIPLDPLDAGYVDLTSFGTNYDQVVMVVANVADAGVTSYQYGTTGDPLAVGDGGGLAQGLRLEQTGGNPFSDRTTLRLNLDRDAYVRATVHDVSGSLVRTIAFAPLAAGVHDLGWDGRDESGARAPGGVYFVRAADQDGREVTRRILLVH